MNTIKRLLCISLFFLINTITIFSMGEKEPQAKIKLKFATGNESSVYYHSVGTRLAEMWNNSFDDSLGENEVQVETVFSRGTAFNILDMRKGEVDIAIAPANIVYDIREGRGIFENNTYKGVRLLTPLWIEFSHFIVTKKSKITIVADMKGKRISIGMYGARSEYNAIKILETIGGIKRERIFDKRYPTSEVSAALRDKQVDVVYIEGGVPLSMATTLLNNKEYNLLNIDKEEYEESFKDEKGYGYFEIPSNTYPLQVTPRGSVGVKLLLLVNESVPDKVVYTLMQTYFEMLETLQQEYITLQSFDRETMYDAVPSIPLHAGALSYMEEIGFIVSRKYIEIPDETEEGNEE